MIDEDRTMQLYGYTSDELKPKSCKNVIAVCERCGKYRVTTPNAYKVLCRECKFKDPETKLKMSIANSRPRGPMPEEQKKNISRANIGKKRPPFSDEHCKNISKGKKGKPTKLKGYERSFDQRKKLSAINQGVEEDDWTGFASERKYCSKFNDELKLKIRAQYNFECVMCDMTEGESKIVYNEVLSIHHIDGNKDQGCNGNEIRMIPLCKKCHGQSHHDPMKSRIDYLVDKKILL
jgi:hypothetical protein